jgi:hypothetical protein
MFQEQNYQAGGIVGYAGDGAEGQQVQGYQPDEINALAERDGGLGKYVQQALAQQRAINAVPIATSQAEKDLAAMLRSPPTDENKMMWMSLLRGGLKTLGGTSPHAAVNLGQGLGEAAQAYEEGLKEQQKQKLAYAKEMADQARAQRQEGLSALTLGAKLKESEDTLQAALARAAKEGDMNTYIRLAVTAAREKGDKRPESELAQLAADNYLKLKVAFDPRVTAAAAQTAGAGAAVKQAVVSETKAESDKAEKEKERLRKEAEDAARDRREALDRFEKRWEGGARGTDRILAKQIREAKTEGGLPAVEALRNRMEQDALNKVGAKTSGSSAPPSGFQPKGSGQLPPGFQLVR